MWNDWWLFPLGIVGGLVLIWGVLMAVLWLTKPGDCDMKDALRLLPDLIRLVKRLATDPDTPRGVRIRLALLLVYPFLIITHIQRGDFMELAALRDETTRARIRAVGMRFPDTPAS